ncbi:MAG: tetratricopeptide repeat protein, partial [Acidobacteriota bacterium]|nr:tetratricopeptide repeat protein [Acidobacteriota bacterium]
LGAANVELARKLFARENINVAVSLSNCGDVQRKQENHAKAIMLYREALAIAERCFPTDARIIPYQKKLALALLNQKHNKEAETLLERTLALEEKLAGDHRFGIMELREQLAALAAEKQQWEKAKSLYYLVLNEKRRLLGPRHIQVAETMNRLARILLVTNDHLHAGLLLQEALVINRGAGKNAGELQRNLGLAQIVRSYTRLGEQSFRQALASDVKEYGPEHRTVAADLYNLGTLLSTEGENTEACRLLQKALDIDRKLLARNDPQLNEDLLALGRARRALREYQAAEDLFREAFAKLKEWKDTPPRELARVGNELGILFYWRFAKAKPGDKALLQQAERFFVQATHHFLAGKYEKNLLELHISLIYLGLVYEAGPDLPRQFEGLYEEVLKVQGEILGWESNELIPLFLDLAKIYSQLKRFTDAEQQLKKAKALIARDSGENSTYYLQVCCQQADLLARTQKREAAATLYETIAAKLESMPLKEYAYLWVELRQLCDFFQQERQYERALKVYSLIEKYQLNEFPSDLSMLLSVKKQIANLYKQMNRKVEAKSLAQEIDMLQQRLKENGLHDLP